MIDCTETCDCGVALRYTTDIGEGAYVCSSDEDVEAEHDEEVIECRFERTSGSCPLLRARVQCQVRHAPEYESERQARNTPI